MLNLLEIDSLSQEDILQIWQNVTDSKKKPLNADIAWSFEGNGIRTRTTFVQAFQKLGAKYVELPNFLKTNESVEDLAGYMDSFYSMYVIRDSNHQRMKDFSEATTKPVINAMSDEAHPCEVLTDAYWLSLRFSNLHNLRILLWGPTSNVFKSWHSLSRVLSLDVTHYCPREFHLSDTGVHYTDNLTSKYDVVITDAWTSGFSDSKYCLSENDLETIGNPLVLPTPPVTIGNELQMPISQIGNFAGYSQKALLLPVQMEIISYLLNND